MLVLLASAGIALLISLFATPLFIKGFARIGWGQFIRDDGPQSHHVKRGTPTMGGLIFIVATLLGYFGGKLLGQDAPTLPALLILLLMVGMGAVGFIDDFMKISNQRSLGLGGWAKVAGQVVVSVLFGVLAITVPYGDTGRTVVDPVISGVRDIPWLDLAPLGAIGGILFVLWILLMNVSASNAVNVTDGLDGLATGAVILSTVGYAFIAFWQFNQSCFVDGPGAGCYDVLQPLDVATLGATIVGALIGFLWWNTSPAQIFMGDVGSLALGGALAGFAIMTDTQLLLILIAGLPIVVTGSVIVQRAYFKATGGKRVFLMTPLHHHFELKGWAEVTIVVRFWIVAGLFVAAAIGLFYFEWALQS
ncbi:phospho-N-acetylmuramoyl-pentapeptide-transferase [Agrococcus sp. ARC_14]|uniref:phospho-N-acetylmuramoyl-pentapeptide- transferase n=1 Tax=Agrococcus sp. ARC_14 TaxID=2919927 RepID=UPI001F06615C|nr:phospho-N-acetylmuramoyl-pentapeptide-transferase [Agrococcus sp. ARC_14]MCH1883474.1 phospho-N-acetylmuramoyl-pentapeptide-transferase [Agrococcus sp. ARC_14]